MILFKSFLLIFGALFPIVNPIGSSFIFLSMVRGCSKSELKTLSIKIAIYSTILLIIVLLLGALILSFFGVTIPILQISGGLLLAYVGWTILYPQNDQKLSSPQDLKNLDKKFDEMAFYPLTMPITVGASCIAVTSALGTHRIVGESLHDKMLQYLGYNLGLIFIGFCIFICYRYAGFFSKKLGQTGEKVIMSVAGFINICIGFEIAWHGVKQLT